MEDTQSLAWHIAAALAIPSISDWQLHVIEPPLAPTGTGGARHQDVWRNV